MKFNISYPLQGTQKSFEIDDDNKCRIFFEKRLGQQVQADTLGDDFKGYVFKISGGDDKDGFPMKQGVFSNGRVRLLLSTGTSCYRPKRTGQRKRKSVRGCIVGPDIRALSLVLVKKGEKQIPGLTDVTKSRRLGPKRVTGIRKLYGLERGAQTNALIKKNVIRRTFTSKKNPNAPVRNKAPKIQRLVTDARLRRKRIIKKDKVARWNATRKATEQYLKLYNEWADRKRKQLRAKTHPKAEEPKVVKTQEKKAQVKPKKNDKPVVTKPVVTKPVVTKPVVTKPVEKKQAPTVTATTGAQVKATITKAKKTPAQQKK